MESYIQSLAINEKVPPPEWREFQTIHISLSLGTDTHNRKESVPGVSCDNINISIPENVDKIDDIEPISIATKTNNNIMSPQILKSDKKSANKSQVHFEKDAKDIRPSEKPVSSSTIQCIISKKLRNSPIKKLLEAVEIRDAKIRSRSVLREKAQTSRNHYENPAKIAQLHNSAELPSGIRDYVNSEERISTKVYHLTTDTTDGEVVELLPQRLNTEDNEDIGYYKYKTLTRF